MTYSRARPGPLPALLALFCAFAALYVVEAWTHHSPWIFFDELDHAQNSRKIADLGTLPGAKPWSFEGLYPFAIAPAWLLGSVQTGYLVAKVIGAVVMTASIFPAYALARTLGASIAAALFAAAMTVAVPALSYTSTLMTETLAYPYATLCVFLAIKALSTRTRGWTVGAVAAAVCAPLVRNELAVVPAALAAAAVGFFAIPVLGRSTRRWAAALAAVGGGLALLAWAATHASTTWSVAVAHPRVMLDYARSGLGSLAIGTAIVPFVAGLAAVVRPREEPFASERRAFRCVLLSTAAGFVLYAAAKGAYFGPLANPVEERNLIYIAPALLAGTALWLTTRRSSAAAVAVAGGLTAWFVVTVPLHLGPLVPASDAPSLEILHAIGLGARTFHLLLGLAVLAAACFVLAGTRAGAAAVVPVAVVMLAWAVASEVYVSHRSARYASALAAPLPRPFDWIDRATGGRPSIYVGEQILEPSDIWLLSFWNPGLVRMRSLDRTPAVNGSLRSYNGIPLTGDIRRIHVGRDGTLPVPGGVEDLVGDIGVVGDGRLVGQEARWSVYRLRRPRRLRSAALGLYSDGWIGARSTLTVYNGAFKAVSVHLSRTAGCGAGPARATFAIGPAVRGHARIPACKTVSTLVPTPRPPFRISIRIRPTFVPAQLDPGLSSDTRRLGAQLGYSPER